MPRDMDQWYELSAFRTWISPQGWYRRCDSSKGEGKQHRESQNATRIHGTLFNACCFIILPQRQFSSLICHAASHDAATCVP